MSGELNSFSVKLVVILTSDLLLVEPFMSLLLVLSQMEFQMDMEVGAQTKLLLTKRRTCF